MTFSGLNPNTYTGTTSIEDGILTLSGGSGLVDSTSIFISSSATFDLELSQLIGSIGGAGQIQLDEGVVLSAGGNNSSTTFSGIISGDGGFTKQGSGVLSFSGQNPNTYTGATTIEAGTLQLSGGSGLADASALAIASGAIFGFRYFRCGRLVSGAGEIQLALV